MLASLTHFFQITLVHLGPLGVFVGSFFGEIVGPLPAVSIIVGATFSIVRHAQFSLKLLGDIFVLIALPDAFGATIGSFVTYSVGYWGGKPAIVRWGKYFGFSWKSVEKVHDKLATSTKDEWVLFVVRAVPLLPSIAVNIVCGILQIPKTRYAIITFFGTMVRAFIYGYIGWSLGGAYRKYAHFANIFERRLLITAIVTLMVYIVWRVIKAKKSKSDTI
ncbi:MAG: VTT domain-containing protein [bacterium]